MSTILSIKPEIDTSYRETVDYVRHREAVQRFKKSIVDRARRIWLKTSAEIAVRMLKDEEYQQNLIEAFAFYEMHRRLDEEINQDSADLAQW